MRTNISKELKKTYKLADNIFLGISKFCFGCNTCCGTYGWLLTEEANFFLDKGYPAVVLNGDVHCFDSFISKSDGQRVLNKIPKCLFYNRGKCSIYRERPLDCRLYPIKLGFEGEKVIIYLSLGCKYVSSLTEEEKNRIYWETNCFFTKSPGIVINKYVNLMKKVHGISKPKYFRSVKLAELKRKTRTWEIIKQI